MAPKKLVKKLWNKIDKESQIFLNGRMSYINSSQVPYYKLLKEIYDIIIVNWNTSVSNVFIMFFGRDGAITKEQLKDFFSQQIIADIGSIEKGETNFDEFFTKFFDTHNSGYANLASILNAFHDSIEIKLSFDRIILLCLNAVVDYEHFLNSELYRLYKNNEMIRGLGYTYEVLEETLEKITTNKSNLSKNHQISLQLQV